MSSHHYSWEQRSESARWHLENRSSARGLVQREAWRVPFRGSWKSPLMSRDSVHFEGFPGMWVCIVQFRSLPQDAQG